MPVIEFERALQQRPQRPRGARVSQVLWDALSQARLIGHCDVPLPGGSPSGFRLPAYQGVLLVLDPDVLDSGRHFLLPDPHQPSPQLSADPSHRPPVRNRAPRWLGRA